MGKRKSAGRCYGCNKWIALDDFEVVVDMTVAAMKPSWAEYHEREHKTCGPECMENVEGLVRQLLTDNPICSACWHRMNKVRPLAEGVMDLVQGGVQAVLPDNALFQWKKVAREQA